MRTLLLLRHAKSSWKNPGLADHDRPLNKRGRRDAPRMGELLVELDLVPELILSSTAVRARSTAEAVAARAGYAEEARYTERLYGATPAAMVAVLRELEAAFKSVMIVAHNPGLLDFVTLLTGRSEPFPTAALARIELPIRKWSELRDDTGGRLLGLWHPKQLER